MLASRQVSLGFFEARDACEREHGGHATAVAKEYVGLQAVPHHQRAGRVHTEIFRDALEHIRAGLAHYEGLTSRGCLHRSRQASGTCGEGILGQQEGGSWVRPKRLGTACPR